MFQGAGRDVEELERDLASRYGQRLRLFAARRIGDASAAEDIAQESLARVVDALRNNQIENIDALPGFVFTTARNICLHWVRSMGREQGALARLSREPATTRPVSHDPLAALITEERRSRVRAALATLGDDDRALLAMLYYEGIDSDEAAKRLGASQPTVRVRKHRALGRLAQSLGELASGNETDLAGTLE